MRLRKHPLPVIILLALVPAGASLFFFLPAEGASEAKPKLLTAGMDIGYVDSEVCMPCHSDIYESYRRNGMGRSFFRMRKEVATADWSANNVFYHEASDRYYTMYERDGKYYQRRHQLGFDGKETNILEKEIHWVVGSGLAVRTYLHRTHNGKLLELPVAWYSEKGGFWAMNPGYDRPDHFGFLRVLDHQCMFCHNGYADIEPGADFVGGESVFPGRIPEGIDCQRCHGPGRAHVESVTAAGSTMETIRSSIVNPGRLSTERQLEVCISCHLQTTTARLPGSIVRYDRGIFSFQPGEALSDYAVYFDHARGAGYDDKFEILSAAYRLFQSACFRESDGSMTCTTCHNAHDISHGEEAVAHYVQICKECHSTALEKLMASSRHTKSEDCLGCHMPKRRTEDVIHAVMTDHKILRLKPKRDLLAPLREDDFYGRNYRGEVILYEPVEPMPAADQELYLAVAQVRNNANLKAGIPRLERAIEKHRPEEGQFYFALAEAYVEIEQISKAIPAYEEALRRTPDLWPAQHKLGVAFLRSGQLAAAENALRKAAEMGTEEAVALNDLALVYRQQGRLAQAEATLKKAISLDRDLPQSYNNLGGVMRELRDLKGAEAAFRNAIRIQPDFGTAHHNLAKLLFAGGDVRQAQYHFEKSIQFNQESAQAQFDYALVLTQAQMYEKAQERLETAVRLRSDWPQAHNTLGEVLVLRGRIEQAIRHYRQALEMDPAFYQAHLNLGSVLFLTANQQEALRHLREAAKSADNSIRQQALEWISQIEGR